MSRTKPSGLPAGFTVGPWTSPIIPSTGPLESVGYVDVFFDRREWRIVSDALALADTNTTATQAVTTPLDSKRSPVCHGGYNHLPEAVPVYDRLGRLIRFAAIAMVCLFPFMGSAHAQDGGTNAHQICMAFNTFPGVLCKVFDANKLIAVNDKGAASHGLNVECDTFSRGFANSDPILATEGWNMMIIDPATQAYVKCPIQ